MASLENGVEVLVNLSFADINAIKLESTLCTTEYHCYMSITSFAITDMAENDVYAVDCYSSAKSQLLSPDMYVNRD